MVVLGVDAHKRTHTIVAVDQVGAQLATLTVEANPQGHLRLRKWVSQWPERKWALEDCRPFTRNLERDLLRFGEAGVRVSPKMMADHRKTGRLRGKSDPIDALAVARAALREPNLPVISLEGKERELRLLVDHREDFVAQRTSNINRIHTYVHELDATLELKDLTSVTRLEKLLVIIAMHESLIADLAMELIALCISVSKRIKDLERQIETLVKELAPSLLTLPGCGALSAAKIVGEVASVSRFKSRDAFAMHNGTAPVPVWSSNRSEFRLSRGGNRQINAAIHRIAITQVRWVPEAKEFVERQIGKGHSPRKARRALKRKVSNRVYSLLKADEQLRHLAAQPNELTPLQLAG